MSHFAKKHTFLLCLFHSKNCIPQSLHSLYKMKIPMLLANIIRVKLDNSILHIYTFSYDKLMDISFYLPSITLVSIYCMGYHLLLISICTIIFIDSLYLFLTHKLTLSTYTQLSLILDIPKFFEGFHFPALGLC